MFKLAVFAALVAVSYAGLIASPGLIGSPLLRTSAIGISPLATPLVNPLVNPLVTPLAATPLIRSAAIAPLGWNGAWNGAWNGGLVRTLGGLTVDNGILATTLIR